MRLLILLFLTLTTTFAIVDIASIDFGEKDNGFSGSLYGSFQKKRGNTDTDEAEYGGRIQYDTNKSITWLQGSSERDEARGYTTAENAFVHLRHIHQVFNPDWAMELFVQLKQDKFKNLNKRTVIGTGPRCKIADSPSYGKLFLGASVMDERIIYNEVDADEHNYRVNTYLSYGVKINKTFELSYLGYYQQKINDSSDYLTSSIAEMTIHLTKVFDLSYLVEFDYDSAPPNLVDNTDTRQKLSFIYRFGQDDPLSAYAQNILQSSKALEDEGNSNVVAVEVNSNVEEIGKPSDTLAGKWMSEEKVFSIFLNGKGFYSDKSGLHQEDISWKVISTEPSEGMQEAKDQSTKLVVIKFTDGKGTLKRTENYLWNENILLGLVGSKTKLFKR